MGTPIYRYTYASAMVNGYIKRLHAINIAPQEIQFTYRNDQRRHTLEEVLALREEAWFRRGVALAPECNRHIVEASIRRCLMMREKNGFQHQIIALCLFRRSFPPSTRSSTKNSVSAQPKSIAICRKKNARLFSMRCATVALTAWSRLRCS